MTMGYAEHFQAYRGLQRTRIAGDGGRPLRLAMPDTLSECCRSLEETDSEALHLGPNPLECR